MQHYIRIPTASMHEHKFIGDAFPAHHVYLLADAQGTAMSSNVPEAPFLLSRATAALEQFRQDGRAQLDWRTLPAHEGCP